MGKASDGEQKSRPAGRNSRADQIARRTRQTTLTQIDFVQKQCVADSEDEDLEYIAEPVAAAGRKRKRDSKHNKRAIAGKAAQQKRFSSPASNGAKIVPSSQSPTSSQLSTQSPAKSHPILPPLADAPLNIKSEQETEEGAEPYRRETYKIKDEVSDSEKDSDDDLDDPLFNRLPDETLIGGSPSPNRSSSGRSEPPIKESPEASARQEPDRTPKKLVRSSQATTADLVSSPQLPPRGFSQLTTQASSQPDRKNAKSLSSQLGNTIWDFIWGNGRLAPSDLALESIKTESDCIREDELLSEL